MVIWDWNFFFFFYNQVFVLTKFHCSYNGYLILSLPNLVLPHQI